MQAFVVLVFDCCNCITCHSSYVSNCSFRNRPILDFHGRQRAVHVVTADKLRTSYHKANWCRTVPWWRKFGHGWVLVDCEEGMLFADCNPSSFLFFCCFCLLDLINFSSQHDCSGSLQLILRWCQSILPVSRLDVSSSSLPNVKSEGAKKQMYTILRTSVYPYT